MTECGPQRNLGGGEEGAHCDETLGRRGGGQTPGSRHNREPSAPGREHQWLGWGKVEENCTPLSDLGVLGGCFLLLLFLFFLFSGCSREGTSSG